MRIFALAGFALCLCCAAFTAGCGSPSQKSGFVPAPVEPAGRAPHGRTWMAKGAAKWDLLYVSNGNGVVNVYRYWKHNLIGTLTNFQEPLGECVDAAGDVYIADYRANDVVEYAHGAKKPLRTLSDSIDQPYACAVNLKNGDLAIANLNKGVAVFPHATGKPIVYTDRNLFTYEALAYDDRGNLLVTNGCYFGSSCYGASFALLPRTGVNMVTIDVRPPGRSSSNYFEGVSAILWDGKYFVIDDYALYRYRIRGTNARYVSTTNLSGEEGYPVWIYSNDPAKQGTEVVGAEGEGSRQSVDFWQYPAGGSSIGQITHGLDGPYGVTISLKTER
jgi:hypothetical protein